MALVYTIAQQKGGAGKTTLAANLAAHFAATLRVALVDIDPQRSLARWHALRRAHTPPPAALAFAELAGWRLGAELGRLAAGHDLVVIDSPPHVETDARIAIRAASLVLVPLQPSPPDLWAAEGTLKLAASERRPVRLVLNRAPARSRLRSWIGAECARQGLTLLQASLGNRASVPAAFAAGLGITEYAPRSLAAAELRALADSLG